MTLGDLQGVEAVIDKDLASSLLARAIGADLFLLSTGVERVAIDFNTPRQRWLDRMSLSEARRYSAEDQFDKGSMGPKISSALRISRRRRQGGTDHQPSEYRSRARRRNRHASRSRLKKNRASGREPPGRA